VLLGGALMPANAYLMAGNTVLGVNLGNAHPRKPV
jgi:hypothetical protein